MSSIDISSKRAEALRLSVLQNSRLESRDLDQDPGILPIPESTDLGFSMVGNGDSHSWCGKWRLRACFNRDQHLDSSLDGSNPFQKDVVQPFKASCGRLDCPICYEKAAGKLAIKIEWRLKHFSIRKRVLKPIHVTASVPVSVYHLDYKKLKARAIKLLKISGLFGGCIIFHPWRKKGSLWVFSPHFHSLGYGWIKNVDHVFEDHGWIIKNHGIRKTVSGTALYQLSHAGFSKKLHTVTWFGALSYNKISVPKMPDQVHNCPICGEKLVAARCVDPELWANMITRFSKSCDGRIFFVDPGLFEEDFSYSVDPGGGSFEVVEKRLLKFLDQGGIIS